MSVISLPLARRLRDLGLTWTPAPGDRFVIPDRGMDDEVFVLSDLTIEVHERPEGRLLGFNGTVEWALDSVQQDETLWLPREDQLRQRLGDAFDGLRIEAGRAVVTVADGRRYVADHVEEAYGEALAQLLGDRGAGDGAEVDGAE